MVSGKIKLRPKCCPLGKRSASHDFDSISDEAKEFLVGRGDMKRGVCVCVFVKDTVRGQRVRGCGSGMRGNDCSSWSFNQTAAA